MIIIKRLRILTLIAALLMVGNAAKADLVILQYHHVDDSTPAATSTSVSLFEAQLQMIQELDLEVVPLLSGTRQALAGELETSRQIAITFDDAYESVYSAAVPILERFGVPYTIFVNTDAIGSRGYMTWDEIRELGKLEHVTIANHSTDHAHMARRTGEPETQWTSRVNHSLDEAQKELKRKLGIDEPMFAYPYGEFDEALEAKLAERGWYGYGQQSGAVGRWSHDTRLPRFPMANAYGQLGSLKDKLLSRAFPVPAKDLPDGVIDSNPPAMSFPLGEQLDANRLTCFASGMGRIDFTVTDGIVRVKAPKAFQSRRFRYNCTHPAGQGSFYWLSQQWLDRDKPED
ncbi:polysaccharide deacetylase family protein [Marinobacter sp.]|uniref:polysaccharide deacetylase family protein n=1 Tax=Marinobacter sp. TaxID=50741 RepID=UPI001A0D587C|nr:polysaccharide deacetylase family protein [Marinobacter sp.]MBE0484585.1 polysaccharide deacetylase family protein [Marinobacter sp.]